MTILCVGQWWLDGNRKFNITGLSEHTVQYIEITNELVFNGLTSRIQWEFDVERGKLKKEGGR